MAPTHQILSRRSGQGARMWLQECRQNQGSVRVCQFGMSHRGTEMETTYMRHMVVELEVVVYNGVIDMIELEEVLQRPCPLLV